MQYRYITTLGNDIIWGKNSITVETLQMVKDGRYDMLIDTQNNTWFNAKDNQWEDINGDN